MINNRKAIFYAVLAAALYAINAPISKLLLTEIPSTMMAGLLYLGAGVGMYLLEKFNKHKKELPLTKNYGLPLSLLHFPVCCYLLKI